MTYRTPPRRVSLRGTLYGCLLPVAGALAALLLAGVHFPAFGQGNSSSELVTQEAEPTFKLQVQRNLVVVRVVVRDARGRVIPNLRKEDFRILDNGKPQSVVQFALETALVSRGRLAETAQPPADTETLPETAVPANRPQRYLALFFDDVHMAFEEVARTRDAADGYLASVLQPSDRVGIFTASGQTVLDFTDDRGKLHESLFHLRPLPIVPREQNPCPDISDLQAYRMVHEKESRAIDVATREALVCHYNNDELYLAQAQAEAEAEAARALSYSETESEDVFRVLDQLIRRVSALPGQRNIVMVSPGFLDLTQEYRTHEVVDRALRSSVVISTFDARGLYVSIPGGDVTKTPVIFPDRADLSGKKSQLEIERASMAAEPLRNIANDTGGEFFHNSNDFNEGFRKVGALPEAYYVLAFSPQNLKLDGRFHTLKVSVVAPKGLTIQARRGYFAPKTQVDPAQQAKEEIEQAVFSQDEVKELPVDIHTQFFKVNEEEAKLAILTHVDIRLVRFRKGEGRNLNNLTFVTALFDRDGKYMHAKEKRLEFRLFDGSLERLQQSGITMRTSFDVRPGTYLVRQVVRDSEGGQLAGLNRTVEIPF